MAVTVPSNIFKTILLVQNKTKQIDTTFWIDFYWVEIGNVVAKTVW